MTDEQDGHEISHGSLWCPFGVSILALVILSPQFVIHIAYVTGFLDTWQVHIQRPKLSAIVDFVKKTGHNFRGHLRKDKNLSKRANADIKANSHTI
ncbi:MAG: hypothetical protein KJO26_11210 [Deltaproteobacteria bacterium]|nr:hypothetical protein [Deltaproteobacteria bacterium]